MSKRRRPAAARRMAEQRFWGLPRAAAAEPDGADAAPTNGHEAAGDPAPQDSRPTGAASAPAPARRIRPTSDPGALVRSLGPPPLALDSAVVERHLTAVYEEAVRTATALAAATGLLADDSGDPEGPG
jgi:hypothetical protein